MSRVEEIQKQIQESKKELEFEKQKAEIEYSFKNGEEYWVLWQDGYITDYIWDGSDFDKVRYSQGNIFKTKAEAKRESDKRALLTRFRQFRDKCNGDWKPFECDHQFYLSFDTMTNVIHINCVYINKSFALFGYFKKKSDAERAIELFGDEIKRLFVEVN